MSSSASTSTSEGGRGRSIEKIVPATDAGKIVRLLGSLDCDGAGTLHPQLTQADPFILCDAATVTKHQMPPFGAHPHRGHSVVTVLLQGRVQSWDSFRSKLDDAEKHKDTISAPASYWVDAGTGIFHDEKSVIEDESDPTQHMRVLQLWVGVHEEDRLKAPRVQYDQDLPTFECMGTTNDAASEDGGKDVVVGKGTYHVGGMTKIETPHPITVVHIIQQPGTTYHVPIDNPTHGGFVVILKGNASFGNDADGSTAATPTNDYDVMVLSNITDNDDDDSKYLQVTTPTSSQDEYAEYVVCTGERHNQVWAKKLVANGAIIAATAEEARVLALNVAEMSKKGKVDGGSFAPFGME